MAKTSIPLGKSERLEILFAYPNIPDKNEESLETTIQHWLGQTLMRDGLRKEMASVRVEGGEYVLDLDGPSDQENTAYAKRIPKILEIGWAAWHSSDPNSPSPMQQIKSRKVWGNDDKTYPMWDPNGKGWRFFLTLGVGLVNHRSLQFFHYPPIRLLNPLRDSMKDPVTERCRDLLVANGVDKTDTHFYETRINSTPIAAPDDQGTNTSPPADPVWGGLLPIGYFRTFEVDMISTLIKPHPTVAGFTIPMTVYGKDPRQRFGGMFLNPDKAMIIQVLPNLKTPVLGSNHPFNFYYQAQAKGGKGEVGSGKMLPGSEKRCTQLQQEDLAVVRWQVEMARDPSQDPWEVIRSSQAYWKQPANQETVCALVRRHGSLTYADPQGYEFYFKLSLEKASEECKKSTHLSAE